MNHQGIVAFESDSRLQHSRYILHRLDDSHFNALNPGGHVLGLNGYCLDAPDEMPAGSMLAMASSDAERRRGRHAERGTQSLVIRGIGAAEIERQRKRIDELIDELLTEKDISA